MSSVADSGPYLDASRLEIPEGPYVQAEYGDPAEKVIYHNQTVVMSARVRNWGGYYTQKELTFTLDQEHLPVALPFIPQGDDVWIEHRHAALTAGKHHLGVFVLNPAGQQVHGHSFEFDVVAGDAPHEVVGEEPESVPKSTGADLPRGYVNLQLFDLLPNGAQPPLNGHFRVFFEGPVKGPDGKDEDRVVYYDAASAGGTIALSDVGLPEEGRVSLTGNDPDDPDIPITGSMAGHYKLGHDHRLFLTGMRKATYLVHVDKEHFDSMRSTWDVKGELGVEASIKIAKVSAGIKPEYYHDHQTVDSSKFDYYAQGVANQILLEEGAH